MNLKYSQEYYTTDQGIKNGATVAVWGLVFNSININVCRYDRYEQEKELHVASGILWQHACPIEDLVEIAADGNPVPEAPGEVVERYGDVWAKAYIASGDAKIADDTLAAYKAKEAKGDFDKAVSAISADPVL